MKSQLMINIFEDNNGQTILEYLIITSAILIGFLLFNDMFIPQLNHFYCIIAKLIRSPIP